VTVFLGCPWHVAVEGERESERGREGKGEQEREESGREGVGGKGGKGERVVKEEKSGEA